VPSPFVFPTITRRRLASGLLVLAARHGEMPVATATLVLRAGGTREPPGREGLAHLTAEALDTGTARHDGNALAWAFERLGVELETSASWDALVLRVHGPLARFEPALALLAEVARAPTFPHDEVERLRDEQAAAILQHRTEPRALASDMAARFLYAPGTRYAHPLLGELASVRSLDREAVTMLHAEAFAPDGAALTVAGALDSEAALAMAERHFGGWTGTAAAPPTVAARPRVDRTTLFLVDRPGAVQSELRIGHPSVGRSHPDHAALLVMNTLLGGAFTSRLNLNLRERHGFTYGARSSFAFRRDGGPFIVSTAVGTHVTARAVEEILHELRRLRDDGAQDDEVARARDYLIGSQPLELQTANALAGRLVELFVHDLPDDHFRHQREAIAAVRTEDVLRVAREHLHPERLAIVVVAAADAVREPLTALGAGPVEEHAVEDA
jgi:zinc protease